MRIYSPPANALIRSITSSSRRGGRQQRLLVATSTTTTTTSSGRWSDSNAARLSTSTTADTTTFTSSRAFSSSQQLVDGETGLLKFNTLHELQENACQVYSHDHELFGTFSESSQKFEYMTYSDFGQRVEECRSVLKDLGVRPFDRIALISNNRWEWPVIACAAYSLQASLVPMYEAQLPSDWTYILNDSGASVVICSTEEIFHALNDVVLTQTPHVHSALCLDAEHGAAYAYSTAVERVSSKSMLSKITLPPMPEDLANLLYTSGTTGKPKGVELTHSNFCSNIHGGRAMAGNPFELVSTQDRSLAFLPWAHSYGQTVELWMGMSAGASAGICRGIPHILDDLAMVKPTILFSVPTLYKKVYDGVQNKIEAGGDSLPSRLLRTALQLGHENASYKRGEKDEPLPFVQRIQFAALDKIVLSKIRDRFGGRLRYGCVAGAACPTPVIEFMDSSGSRFVKVAGASAGICRGIPHILDDLAMVKPTILFSVPTLYKKVYDGVQNKIEAGGDTLPSRLLRTALELGHQNASYKRGEKDEPLPFMQRMQFAVLDKIVLSKIRERFGGRLRYGCVAGAACPTPVLEFMDSIGIPICEGYGLTETSPIITLNVPDARTVGSVGRPLNDVTVYIVDEDGKPVPPGAEGEICCVGPNVMRGYYNNPEATNEVITVAPDGVSRMFHTGDVGRVNANGWLSVTGRIKEQYKLENGKFVVPTPIEDAIGMSRFIDRVVVTGANRPHNVVLIVPEWAAIREELDVDEEVSEEEIVNDVRLKTLIDEELRQSCAKLKKFEIPKAWMFVAPFTVANNMLTQKQSTRRHKVIEAYKDAIDHLYDGEALDAGVGMHVPKAA
eukprot:CAMPEP_0113495474 /NCGR_PEP_ID=MMETSP0014_2-20120614/29629_1 /TAXON_ID=2857 /ORGANISM="Nitzschia sp." /LENGTH=843 /DNA_ID=CAMNT_0000389375 /DNA_START=149 /DNA_END=2681 /DNA_ORIENTATION=- /assembly_acc=CAM_ASM_000159